MVKKDSTTSSTEKKAPVKREDPVLKLERQLAEARERKAEYARKNLDEARAALGRAENQIERWTRIRGEAAERVRDLEEAAGLSQETPAEADATEE